MRVQRTLTVGTPVQEGLRRWNEINAKVLAGNVSFGSSNTDAGKNIQCWHGSGTTPGTPNTNFTVTHNLGYIPATIVGQDTNNGGLLGRGSVAWTKTQATLRCTTVSAAYNVILA